MYGSREYQGISYDINKNRCLRVVGGHCRKEAKYPMILPKADKIPHND